MKKKGKKDEKKGPKKGKKDVSSRIRQLGRPDAGWGALFLLPGNC